MTLTKQKLYTISLQALSGSAASVLLWQVAISWGV